MDKPIEKAIKVAGGITQLARRLKVTPPTVHQWVSEQRPIPADRAPDIERETGVRCEELCPDEHWQRDKKGQLIGRFIPAA